MKKSQGLLLLITAILLFSQCNNEGRNSSQNQENSTSVLRTPSISFDVIKSYPHDTNSFTEGLVFHNGLLYESSGSPEELPETKSSIATINLKTGEKHQNVSLDKTKYFCEGITFLNSKCYQLTYKSGTGFIYDHKTFKKIGEFSCPAKEGWGITNDGTFLIISGGTDELFFLDPKTLKTIKTLHVIDEFGPVQNINELEFINGYIYANIYTTSFIYKISPDSGKVAGKLNLISLSEEARTVHQNSLEMNGIAWDAVEDKIYITGKMWPSLYEVKFSH
jgi:glutamine cyclotransferase